MNTIIQKFEDEFKSIVDVLTSHYKNTPLEDAKLWFQEVLNYNVPDGKKNRGLSVVNSYSQLVKVFDDKLLKNLFILGWCVEILQAYFLVSDDIMDQSITRRGKLCWYRKENVGNIAINDSLYLYSTLFSLIKKYFGNSKHYLKLIEVFLQSNTKTIYGQCLDMLTSSPLPNSTNNFINFTLIRYATIIKYKTIYYSFYLPIHLALIMSEMDSTINLVNAKIILYYMGYYFQAHDDFLDCYGDYNIMGKIGTDIQDFKCSWLMVNALNKANAEQIILLEKNYGTDNPDNIAKIKQIYDELKMPEYFAEFEHLYVDLVTCLINALPGSFDDLKKIDSYSLHNTLAKFITNYGEIRFKEFFPGDYEEIPDGIYEHINNTDTNIGDNMGKFTGIKALPKDIFWYYHNLIYKRVK